MDFPIKFKNTANMVFYVGDIRFGVNEIKLIHELHYQRNKAFFDSAIKKGQIVVATKRDIKAEDEKIVTKKAEIEKTIMQKYKDGDLHWRTAEKEIKQIEDLEELKKLYQEGFDLGYDLSDVIMKRLRDAINTLELRYYK